MVLAALMDNIANNLPADVLKGQRKVDNPRVLAEKILELARPQDREFVEQFASTQMLMQYLEKNYCAF